MKTIHLYDIFLFTSPSFVFKIRQITPRKIQKYRKTSACPKQTTQFQYNIHIWLFRLLLSLMERKNNEYAISYKLGKDIFPWIHAVNWTYIRHPENDVLSVSPGTLHLRLVSRGLHVTWVFGLFSHPILRKASIEWIKLLFAGSILFCICFLAVGCVILTSMTFAFITFLFFFVKNFKELDHGETVKYIVN